MDPNISIIVALCNRNRVIGKDGGMPWPLLRTDLQRFKRLTMGHPVFMGSKTWESFPEGKRPLPGRTNIILSRNQRYDAPGAVVVNSFESGMQIAYASPGADEIFIGGGASLYEWALPRAKKLYSTVIYNAYDGDTFFPEGLETHFPTPTESEAVEENGVHYVMQTRHRIGPTLYQKAA